jgi:hypothetical protein
MLAIPTHHRRMFLSVVHFRIRLDSPLETGGNDGLRNRYHKPRGTRCADI